ncbi:hypothetical protein [Vibrio syngnathi]|uniref:Uncharacterized protein n=1 Tax=Vibrio syngnathi TaxID=3034029 RepID=A0AA34TQX7_9VIBR|nr:hypothetical protein [Vibrio syngnathi]ARP39446.1 hypothetical protein K08M4_27550 [Vibrio syngnathi]
MRTKTFISFFVILTLYITFWASLASINTDTLGDFIFRARDNVVYSDTILRILNGWSDGNAHSAFSGTSYGYGFGYFLLLSFFASFGYLVKNDQLMSVSLILSNLFPFIIIILIMAKELLFPTIRKKDERSSNINTLQYSLVCFFILVLSLLLPGVNFLMVNLHPELWQSLFFIISGNYLFRFFETRDIRKLIISASLLGLSVGFKISLLPLCLPFAVMLVFDKSSYLEKAKFIFISSVFFLMICAFSLHPLFIIDPIGTFNVFVNDIGMYSASLDVMAIADWDYYWPLDDRLSVIIEWVLHPHGFGFIGIPLSLVLAFFTLYTLKKTCVPTIIKSKLSFSLVCHVINVIFLMSVSTRISTFYLLPTFLFWLVSFYTVIRYYNFSSLLGSVFVTVLLTLVAYQIQCNVNIINHFNNSSLLRKYFDSVDEHESSKALIEFVENSSLPKGSVMFDLEANVPFDSNKWGFDPHGEMIPPFLGTENFQEAKPVSNTWKVTLTGDFSSEPYSYSIAPLQDMLIVSKLRGNYSYVDSLIEQGMKRLYENQSFLVLSRNSPPSKPKNKVENNWYGDNQSALASQLSLAWDKPTWQGGLLSFDGPQDWKDVVAVKFDLSLVNQGGDLSQISSIRIGFLGGLIDINSDNSNIWHYELSNKLVPGRNEITLELGKFSPSVGKVSWGYTTGMLLGGNAAGWKLDVENIELLY